MKLIVMLMISKFLLRLDSGSFSGFSSARVTEDARITTITE